MAAITHPSLTNSQPLAVRPLVGRFGSTLRLWRQRIRERRALADLSERDLADFGATTADVYRELSTPFWRAQPPC
jgi:uncharacterized protein YjiS (DUF1127 family)